MLFRSLTGEKIKCDDVIDNTSNLIKHHTINLTPVNHKLLHNEIVEEHERKNVRKLTYYSTSQSTVCDKHRLGIVTYV
mgnify:CR=1 FL=1